MRKYVKTLYIDACNVMNYQCSNTVSPVEYLMMMIAKKYDLVVVIRCTTMIIDVERDKHLKTKY